MPAVRQSGSPAVRQSGSPVVGLAAERRRDMREEVTVDEAVRKRLRDLPSVEEIVSGLGAGSLIGQYGRSQTVEAVREVLAAERQAILSGASGATVAGEGGAGADREGAPAAALVEQAAALLASWAGAGLRRVLNLSGVVVHTNLGRSRLSQKAIDRVVQVAGSYSNLEYELGEGARGKRETYVERQLTRLTGAEAAFVVNNNAGAVLLLLMGLAAGREVLVSRGQLVEIGGSFRMPDIMQAGGVRLVEVGTTNRTRVEDYEAAITADTALLMRVHTSNYRIVGFTEEPGLEALVELGRRHGVPVVDDLGSGALLDLQVFAGEPTVAASLRVGADVVCFSGDKLLGGPQAGILLGTEEAIGRLRRHPVARALRLDKMTLAALEATLQLYADPERARREIPTLRMLERGPDETVALAERLQAEIEARCADGFILDVEPSSGRAGGGSMPLVELPSYAVRVRLPEQPREGGSHLSAAGLEAELRRAPVPVVVRVSQDSLHLDVLALQEDEVAEVAESVAWAMRRVAARAAAPGSAGGR